MKKYFCDNCGDEIKIENTKISIQIFKSGSNLSNEYLICCRCEKRVKELLKNIIKKR